MSKQDFVLLSRFMLSSKDILNSDASRVSWRMMCRDLATRLGATNAKFDRRRFLAACGMEEGN
jgi:hypothetical protein